MSVGGKCQFDGQKCLQRALLYRTISCGSVYVFVRGLVFWITHNAEWLRIKVRDVTAGTRSTNARAGGREAGEGAPGGDTQHVRRI